MTSQLTVDCTVFLSQKVLIVDTQLNLFSGDIDEMLSMKNSRTILAELTMEQAILS